MRTRNPSYVRPRDVVLGRVSRRASGAVYIRDSVGTEILAEEIVIRNGLKLTEDDDNTAIISGGGGLGDGGSGTTGAVIRILGIRLFR